MLTIAAVMLAVVGVVFGLYAFAVLSLCVLAAVRVCGTGDVHDLAALTWLATIGIVGIFVHAVRLWFVSRPAAERLATARGAATGTCSPSWCPHSTRRG